MKLVKILTVLFCIKVLAGCAVANEQNIHKTRATTIGQELIDLEKAKDANIITDEEFAKAKQDLLKEASMDVSIKR